MAREGWIPYREGELPPRGYVLAQTTDGERFWVPLDSLKESPPQFQLSDEQIERVKRFKWILREHDETPLNEALLNFRRDRYPERELRVWECIAAVYKAELAQRRSAAKKERRLLYEAVLCCSLVSPDANLLLAARPNLKSLPNLVGVVERFRECERNTT